MYKILGADQREYGPVSAEQIADWVRQGRANANTLARAEGAENWAPLATFPEFAPLFVGAPPPIAVAQGLPPNPDEYAARILASDYDLDIGGCISAGWRLVFANFGLLFGGTLIFLLIQAALNGLRAVPFAGVLLMVVSLIVSGPLRAGWSMLFLKPMRGEPTEVGELFRGFNERFWQFVLAYLIPVLIIGCAAIPGGIIVGIAFIAFGLHGFTAVMPVAAIAVITVGVIIAIIPAVYFGIVWQFAVPLTIDKGMEFWEAMGLSHTMVRRHFASVFALVILCALITVAGVLACCVGVLIAIPVAQAAKMYAYETIFSGRSPKAA